MAVTFRSSDRDWEKNLCSPCHRREFNPKGGPYKMFQMILSFVTKTFQNMLVFKILNEGKWCFWHSISITYPKFQVQPHSALKRDILFDKAFYTKRLLCPLSFIWHLGNLCSSSGGCAMTVTVQAYFRRILQLSFIHECPSIKEWPKSPENMPAW